MPTDGPAIVDAHMHIHAPLPEYEMSEERRQRSLASLPLLKLGPDPEQEIDQHLALMDAAGIDRSIIINTQFHPDLGVYRPNAAIARQTARFPDRFGIIAGVRLHPRPDLAELEEAVCKLGCLGVKIVPAVAYVRPDDFELLGPLYERCIELDVPIMWHIGDSGLPGARPRFASFEGFSEAVARYPNLKHVVAHLGGHGHEGVEVGWIEYASTRSNVYIEASYAPRAAFIRKLPLGRRPAPERYLAEFLYPDGGRSPEICTAWAETEPGQIRLIQHAANLCPERFLFATDTPLAISRQIAMDLYTRALGGHGELWDLVMGGNARRLFKL
jgi:predicted TIM-barrel fold metal-dependent hydrolase